MEGDEVIAIQRRDAVRGGLPAVRVVWVHGRPEGLAGDAVRPGHGFLETGNGAGLFAFQDGRFEPGLVEHAAQDIERRFLFVLGRKGAQGHAGAIGIGAAAKIGADVGQLFGNRGLVAASGAEIEGGQGQRGEAGFAGRVEHRAGGEVDLDVEHRQDAAGDEIDAGAGWRYPVLNLGPGQRTLRDQQGGYCGQQLFHGVFLVPALGFMEHQWRVAAADRRGLPSSGCGSSTPTVSVSSVRYFLATPCTSAAVTFCSFSSMRFSLR